MFFDWWSLTTQNLNLLYTGTGRLDHTIPGALVRKDGQPASAWVLIQTANGRGIGKVRSDSAGEWEFRGISMANRYRLVTFDDDGEINAAILDNVAPVPM